MDLREAIEKVEKCVVSLVRTHPLDARIGHTHSLIRHLQEENQRDLGYLDPAGGVHDEARHRRR